MKKYTRFILLLLPLSCFNLNAQDLQTRAKITSNYTILSDKVLRETEVKIENRRLRSIKEAKVQNMPVFGYTRDGSYYEVFDIDSNGMLLYRRLLNAGSRVTARVDLINSPEGIIPSLNGLDMIAGVVDGELALANHEDFASEEYGGSRIVERENDYSGPRDKRFEERKMHATHVAGTIAGGGKLSNGMSEGIAPKATIWSYSWNGDLIKMTKMAQEGVLVSNHSYGLNYFDDNGNLLHSSLANKFGSYEAESEKFDWVTYNYDNYLPVVAAGNDGDLTFAVHGYRSKTDKVNVDMLTGTSVSKNVVVVAAVHDVPNYIGAQDVRLTYFSSQGPTNDFRIKPDIAAKGYKVYSPIYQNPTKSTNELKTNLYGNLSGTSMAAPAVSGVLLLWQQWALKVGKDHSPMKSATVRALMAHTADEAGINPGPDHLFGWGLINALAGVQVLEAAELKKDYAFILEEKLITNQEFRKTIDVKEPRKLIATLAWTDLPGKVSSENMDEEKMKVKSNLVNDLDIVVKKDGVSYFPWKLTKDWKNPIAIKGINDVDNIEKVEIDIAEPGKYEIVVSHNNELMTGAQNFSLVVTVGEFDDLVVEEPIIDPVDPVDPSKEFKDLEFVLWPNPATTSFNVKMGEEYIDAPVSVRIFDLNSRLVGEFNYNSTEDGIVVVPVDKLSSSIYFVEVQSKGKKKQMRIIKQ
ncbi:MULTISPECIES: S8 family serine peptidase [Myroides]|uniref:S8 family serine peptidase n=1 Tax=Myroides albus TaxID=2562892 RepID=A0A6I3LTS2_9FLAO|nr:MULTISPECIES: S8 family serine peptidase [Myroides]MTG99352.1 S8 family serine peptidase [Myroides albus]MVX36318.1 S8 family serine peptidase [Myroides sp. LoEW2-1]UVD80532.1 S8 family serine peptidase [Myroides albus]